MIGSYDASLRSEWRWGEITDDATDWRSGLFPIAALPPSGGGGSSWDARAVERGDEVASTNRHATQSAIAAPRPPRMILTLPFTAEFRAREA